MQTNSVTRSTLLLLQGALIVLFTGLCFPEKLLAQPPSPIKQVSLKKIPPVPNPLQQYLKQRYDIALQRSLNFKGIKVNAGSLSAAEAGLTSTITVTQSPIYAEAKKTETYPGGADNPCAPFKVNFVKSDIEFAVDAASNSQLRDLVYPGSLVNATGLLNGNYSDGLTNPLPAFPMNLSTTMLPLQGGQTSSRTLDAISGTNVKNALHELYLQNAQGGTNAPALQYVEGYILESNSQWKAESKHTWDFDASRSLSVPVEVITIKAGGGANASGSISTLADLQQQRSYAVLMFKHIYYSASIEPVQPAGTAGASGRYFNTDAANIPNNLLYIKTVDYGRIVYVVISANTSRQELAFALNKKFSASIDLGLGVAGADLGIDGSNSGSVSEEVRLNRVFQQSDISYKVIVYGGNPITPANLVFSQAEILNAPNGSVNVLTNKIMSGISLNYSTNNIPLPVSFSCRFARDGVTAWTNSNVNYYSETCAGALKYDVQLELDKIVVSNCRDLDGSEDLYGELKFTYLKAGAREVNTDRIMWSKSENNANENNFRNGTYPIDKKELLITGLTYDQLRNLTLFVGGKLYDDEGIMGSRVFRCQSCQEFSGDFGKRKLYFTDLTNTLNSINTLNPAGQYQSLKFGDDIFFQLDFYESGNSNDGIVKTFWRVNVKTYY